MNQRVIPIRSRKLLNSARGAECSFHFPSICNHDRETTVSAHLTDDTRGAARKADDFASVHACSACHRHYDLRLWVGTEIEPDIHWFEVRALIRTTRARIELGVIVVSIDPPQPFHGKSVKPRKPAEQRARIPSRNDAWPPPGARKMQRRKSA